MLRDFLVNLKERYGISFGRMIWRYWLPHFLSSGLVGALVYWLTSTMLLHIKNISTTDSYTNTICCLLALSSAVLSHVILDYTLNKRGERIMEKVHGLDGHSHETSKMSLKETEGFLREAGTKVKVYRDTCQTVLIATKGASK